jgi:hypothetical protein
MKTYLLHLVIRTGRATQRDTTDRMLSIPRGYSFSSCCLDVVLGERVVSALACLVASVMNLKLPRTWACLQYIVELQFIIPLTE